MHWLHTGHDSDIMFFNLDSSSMRLKLLLSSPYRDGETEANTASHMPKVTLSCLQENEGLAEARRGIPFLPLCPYWKAPVPGLATGTEGSKGSNSHL